MTRDCIEWNVAHSETVYCIYKLRLFYWFGVARAIISYSGVPSLL